VPRRGARFIVLLPGFSRQSALHRSGDLKFTAHSKFGHVLVGQDEFLRDGWLPSSVTKDRKRADSVESAAACQLSLTNPPHTPIAEI
jgi:hypothetical protein